MPVPEQPRYPDPPTNRSAAPIEKPKRSWRGFWFGVLATVALAVLLPIVAYVAVLIYIKTGGVARAVNGAVKESLGPSAQMGEVEVDDGWLIEEGSLRIPELVLPSNDGAPTPALRIKNIRIPWKPIADAIEQRIRPVDIEEPSLELRRNANGNWNFELPPTKPSEKWLDGIQVIGGTLGLEWAPGRRVDLTGVGATMTRARPPLPQTLTLDAQWPPKSEVRAEAILGPGSALKASLGGSLDLKGRVRVAIQEVPKWFEGLNLRDDWTKEGEIVLDDLQVSVPLDQPAGLTYQAKLDVPALRLGIPGVGELPEVKLKAQVSGSLKGAKISGGEASLGDIGRLVFDAQANWNDLNTAWLELLKVVNIRAFDLDLGALLRTEFGRRLMGARFGKGDAPALSELPVLAQGRLSARELKSSVRQQGTSTTVSWSGITASELEIQRSPLAVDLSGFKVNGELSGEVTTAGAALRGIRLKSQLTSIAGAPLTGSFALRLDAGPDGRVGLSGADVPTLNVPVGSLLRIFGLQEYVKCSGNLALADGTFDAATQSAAGLVRFEKLTAEKAGVSLMGLTGQARVTFKDGKLTAKGRIEPAQLVVLIRRFQLPAMELTLSATQGANGQWQELAANLGWENGDYFTLRDTEVTRPERNSIRAKGRLETNVWGGLKGNYDATVDTDGSTIGEWERWKLGPLMVNLENFNLERLAGTPLGAYIPSTLKLAGRLPKLNLEASPFPLAELSKLPPGGSTVVASGEFEKLNIRYSPTGNEMDRSEADRLTGTFRGQVTFKTGSAGFFCNLMTTLKDYELLLDPRYLVFLGSFRPNERFYIPPPKPNEKLIAKFVGQVQPQEGGSMDVKLDNLTLDMGNRLSLAAVGRLTVPTGWDVFGNGEGFLSEVKIGSTDLDALNRDLLQQNIGRRAPDLKLSGAFSYTGCHIWSKYGKEDNKDALRSALCGKIEFQNVSIANATWTATGLNGLLPVSFHQGLWPADWPRERRGTMNWEGIDKPPLKIAPQPVEIVATPNVLTVVTPVKATVTGGEVQLEGLQIQDILSGAPTVDFGFRVNALRFGDIAAAQNLTFKGLNGYGQYPPAVLTGLLNPCRLWREPSVLGTWNLSTNGSLTAPFFQGDLQLTGLYSQDCLGLTPAIGFRELRIDGMSIGSLTAQNSAHGQVKVDANLKVTGFEMLGMDLAGVRKFRMEVRSIPKPDKEYFFERSFAQWLSKEPEEKVSVGKKPLFQHLGWAVELKPVTPEERQQNAALRADDSWLYYMVPLLPNECILTGIRLEGVENSALTDDKRQVKGKATERMLWSEVVTKWLIGQKSEDRDQKSEGGVDR